VDAIQRHSTPPQLWLFKRGPSTLEHLETNLDRDDDDEIFERIRCPLCRWQPSASSQWSCYSGDGPEPPFAACGTTWNTFATRGRCPGCAHRWRWTSCLRCHEWSPHEDWYGLGDAS
jgi:hypothetical protein